MNFDAINHSEPEPYQMEARKRWGGTDAYREYEQKDKRDFDAATRRMMELFAELGAFTDRLPADEAVQEKVHALRMLITEHYYTCTPEILRGLGQMYTADERFKKNIDRAGGTGTADFAARAIEIYCAAQTE